MGLFEGLWEQPQKGNQGPGILFDGPQKHFKNCAENAVILMTVEDPIKGEVSSNNNVDWVSRKQF